MAGAAGQPGYPVPRGSPQGSAPCAAARSRSPFAVPGAPAPLPDDPGPGRAERTGHAGTALARQGAHHPSGTVQPAHLVQGPAAAYRGHQRAAAGHQRGQPPAPQAGCPPDRAGRTRGFAPPGPAAGSAGQPDPAAEFLRALVARLAHRHGLHQPFAHDARHGPGLHRDPAPAGPGRPAP